MSVSVSSAGVVSSTFNALDTIDGGAGSDTLNVDVTSANMTNATTATAQVNTYVFDDSDDTEADMVSVTIDGTTYTNSVAGTTDDALATKAAALINAHMGSAAAVVSNTGATKDATITLTAPTAGTALPSVLIKVLDGASAIANTYIETTFTQANVAATTASTTVDLTTAVATAAGAISNVETVNVTNSGGAVTMDASTYTGVTNFTVTNSVGAITFNDIGTADVTIVGNNVTANGDVTFRGSDGASVTDALVINAQGGVQQGTVTSSHANDDWTSVTINSTGGTETATTMANAFTAMDLAGGNTMSTLTVNATSSISTGVITGWDTTSAVANKGEIVVTGAGKVSLGALDAAVEKVTAGDATGSVRFTASSQTDFTFVGGAGDDQMTTAAIMSDSALGAGSADAGAGAADKLTVAASAHITAASGDNYTNFEVLEVANGQTVDLDHIAGITSIRLEGGGSTVGATDLSAAQAAAVTLIAGGAAAVTVGVKGATTIGNVDAVTLTIDDGAAAAADLVLTAPALAGVETLTLNAAADAVSVSALTSATALTSVVLNATHASSVTSEIVTGATAFGANTHIDASGSTVAVVINADGIVSSTGSSAIKISGGAGADTIDGSGVNADVINGGGGIDTISITADGSTTEIVTIQSDVIDSANADSITGFETTEDLFIYSGALSNGTGGGAISTAEVASATTIAGALATAGAANDIVFIATDDIASVTETAGDAFVAGPTAALANALEEAIVGTSGALNGVIANLDSILGVDDAALFQFSTDTETFC
jgi:hypothetical protein